MTMPDLEPSVGPADPRLELDLLVAQLERMRAMLFGYSSMFFARIRDWAVVSLALLVLGGSGIVPAAIAPVPFIVPFAFLETGYLFYYTVFARRHAERLEQAINERAGREVLAAHRLEAAYFYEPDAPKVAALSLRRPLGFMSAMTVGYSAGALLLWVAGIVGLADFVGSLAEPGLMAWAVPAALVWTGAIVAYLLWTFLRRPDERRLLEALQASYRRRD
jgi:hypothetical protein